MTWLLLLHQVPPSPPYLRAKVLRRLKQVGALALKKSAYFLPDEEDAIEDFQWLMKEIRSEGGEAWVLRTEAVAGITDDSIRESFREQRAVDYRDLLAEAQELLTGRREKGEVEPSPQATLRRLRKRYEEVNRIDFFDAPGKQEAMKVINQIEKQLLEGETKRTAGVTGSGFHGRTWVTRGGIKIDRTACCWLIRRFIDSAAEFLFVDASSYVPRERELRFDMFEGEFTHEGERCSFETLMERFALRDAALRTIAEMVHDLDLKDGKYGRPETAGLAAMIQGLGVRHAGDTQRMEEGMVIFDALYARLHPAAGEVT